MKEGSKHPITGCFFNAERRQIMTSGEVKVFKDIVEKLRRIRRILEKTAGGRTCDRDNSGQGENQD